MFLCVRMDICVGYPNKRIQLSLSMLQLIHFAIVCACICVKLVWEVIVSNYNCLCYVCMFLHTIVLVYSVHTLSVCMVECWLRFAYMPTKAVSMLQKA